MSLTLSLDGTASTAVVTSARTVVVTLLASDDIHGQFGFAPDISAVLFVSNATHRGIHVQLKRVFGTVGSVLVTMNLQHYFPDEQQPSFSTAMVTVFADGQSDGVLFHAFDATAQFPYLSAFRVSLDSVEVQTESFAASPVRLIPGANTTRTTTLISDRYTFGFVDFDAGFLNVSVSETASSVLMLLRRNGPLTQTANVQYTLVSGVGQNGAVSGFDFPAQRRTVVFQPGEAEQTFVIEISDDDVPEDNEVFTVALAGEMGTVATTASATITILSNDGFAGVVGFASSAALNVVEPTGSTRAVLSATVQLHRGDGECCFLGANDLHFSGLEAQTVSDMEHTWGWYLVNFIHSCSW